MKEKGKNKKSDLSDFLRYAEGNMTDKERNAFERELQKDPFAEEAAEGYSEFSGENVTGDVSDLEKQLRNRIYGRRRITFYKIAASVAVLMVIASLLYLLEKNRIEKVPGQISMNQPALDIPESLALTEPPPVKAESGHTEPPVSEVKAEKQVRQAVKGVSVEPEAVPETRSEVEKKSEQAVRPEIKAADKIPAERRAAVPAAAASREIHKSLQARGEIISSEDDLPIAGASVLLKGKMSGVVTDANGKFIIDLPDEQHQILVAEFIGMVPKEFRATTDTEMVIRLNPSALSLNEVVAIGYGTADKPKAALTGYSPPEPVTGRKNFDNYIKENMINPDTLSAGQKAVVVVSFTVMSTGVIDSLKIIRSPGDDFSREAMRLIREGPSWKPAVSDDKKINDEVRIRIVFK